MRVRVPRSRVTHDRWLVSYADFITLLFGFFVVLYASAMEDQKKQAQIPKAIESAFQTLGIFGSLSRSSSAANTASGREQPAIPINIVMGEEVLSPARVKEDLEGMRRDLQQRLSDEVAQHTVAIQMGRDGLVISLREAGFFDSGSALLRPDATLTLRRIAERISQSPYNLRVEGHTDNVPIHTAEFDSNWELSTARATSMTRLLLSMRALPPQRISAAGYAEYHPVDSNATVAGRANNRRVDLVIMPQTRTNLAQVTEPEKSGPWQKITDGDPPAR